jgi:predicted lipid-binding transport protein (Tim44 family)
MLFGNGLFGGLGGFASVLGLIIQLALVAIVARLAWTWWQRRQGLATASGPALRNIAGNPQTYGTMGLGAAASGSAFGKVEIGKSDYDDFERLLNEVSLAYGEEDAARLRTLATPEMQSYFAEQIAGNLSRGVVNKISGIKLEQGDLAEAWREGNDEYASVAMRYAIVDKTVERATGRVVEGADTPQEVIEVWTFVRTRGGAWMLSAIQQAN